MQVQNHLNQENEQQVLWILENYKLFKVVDIVGFTFYNETDSTDNSTYVGITLDENLKKHGKETHYY